MAVEEKVQSDDQQECVWEEFGEAASICSAVGGPEGFLESDENIKLVHDAMEKAVRQVPIEELVQKEVDKLDLSVEVKVHLG